MSYELNEENAPDKQNENETINKKTGYLRLTASMTPPILMQSEIIGVFIVLASICVVIDLIWLIIGGKSLSNRNKN